MPDFQFVARNLYTLKRKYGHEISIQRETEGVIDVITGRAEYTRIDCNIKRAIIFPATMRMLTAIAKAGNIANTTGEISIDDREIVVDIKDLPGEFKHLEQSDYVIFRNRRFEIKRLIFFDSCKGYYLQVREYNTQSLRRNININIKDKFLLVQYLETTNVQSL